MQTTAEDLLRRYASGDREFRGADLRGVDLRRAHLCEVDLGRAILDSASLNDSDLRGASLTEARLGGTRFVGADLRHAHLERAWLNFACLVRARLEGAHLHLARLHRADLRRASLRGADLSDAQIDEAILVGADLTGASLAGATLVGANLGRTNLAHTDLRGANLKGASLDGASLTAATLHKADLDFVTTDETSFVDLDLSETLGLEAVRHMRPSPVGVETLRRSKGRIPETFLRGCGLRPWEIVAARLWDPNLTPLQVADLQNEVYQARVERALQVRNVFVSYSHADAGFVDGLVRRFNERGVFVWRDDHELLAGDLERQLRKAISEHDAVILVLSESSVESDWVEWEVARAREVEKERHSDVLCPIALDDAWKTCGWSGPLRDQMKKKHVLSFAASSASEGFDSAFRRLFDGLQLFYKPGQAPQESKGSERP